MNYKMAANSIKCRTLKPFKILKKFTERGQKSFNSFFSFKLQTHLLRSTAIAANTIIDAPKQNYNEYNINQLPFEMAVKV